MAAKLPKLPYIRRFIRDYLPPTKVWYAWGALFLVLTVACQTILPLWLKRSIALLEVHSDGLDTQARDGLMHYGLLIIACGVGLAFFRSLSRIVIFIPGRRIEAKIRSDYFDALMHNSPTGLDSYTTGDLISRGTGDVTGVRVALSMGVLHILNGVLMLSICLACMLRLSPILTLMCLLPAPLLQYGVRIISTRMMRTFREVASLRGELSESVREVFGAHLLMSVYDVFEPLFERFDAKNKTFQDASERVLKLRALLNVCVSSLSSIAQILLLFGGGFLVIKQRGEFGIDEFVAFSAYLGLIQEPMHSGGWLLSMFQRGETSLERLYSVMDASKDYRENEDSKALECLPSGASPLIRINDLHFEYRSDQGDVPFDIEVPTLELHEGRAYGLFGPVGSGKTTLLHLLTGNLETQRGSRFFRNVDYADIPTRELLRQFSVAPQESRHFSLTIRENIDQVLHNPEWPQSRDPAMLFDEAFRISRMQEDVALFPDGLDSLLGEQGLNLSGGQKQRLSVLRAWTKPHEILVLDDIVSSVDHRTETELLRELYTARRADQTLLIASHRISALMPCDEIWILENGRIVDRGAHAELIERNPDYARTYQHQVLEMAVEA